MTPRQVLDESSIGQVLLVANTPGYIARRLRAEPSVVRCASEFAGEAILADLRDAVVMSGTVSSRPALVHGLMVALSLSEAHRLIGVLDEPCLASVRWGRRVAEYLLATTLPTTIVRVGPWAVVVERGGRQDETSVARRMVPSAIVMREPVRANGEGTRSGTVLGTIERPEVR